MPVDVKVLGHRKLGRVARSARYAQDKGAQKQLRRALTAGAKPLQKAVRTEVPNYMPKRGGYAAIMRKALRLTTKSKTSMRAAGITIKCRAVGFKRHRDVGALQAGRLRHPVFGNMTAKWVTQKIRPHFFTGPINNNIDEVRDELLDAIDQVAHTIARS